MNLKLDWCSYDAAKYACENWHYSGCIPKSKLLRIGVWEDNQYIGVVIFGIGATRDLVKQYGLLTTEGCELVRIALTNHKSTVTQIISISLKMLKYSNPNLKLVVSFADPLQDHKGIIYQASNWTYTGLSQVSDEYIYQGRRWHGRAFRHKYKGMENHPDVSKVKGSAKYRYLMPLNKKMRKQVLKLSKPYPRAVAGRTGTEAPPLSGGSIPTPPLQNKLFIDNSRPVFYPTNLKDQARLDKEDKEHAVHLDQIKLI